MLNDVCCDIPCQQQQAAPTPATPSQQQQQQHYAFDMQIARALHCMQLAG
jgi:hypothetical protein